MLGQIIAMLSVSSAVPTVKTSNGTVTGAAKYGVAGFLGIPFAAAPTGALRFKPPAPHAAWATPLTATAAGLHCTQGAGPTPPRPPAPPGCDAYCKSHHYKPDVCHCGVCGSFGGCSFSCTAGGDRHKCPAQPAALPAAVAAGAGAGAGTGAGAGGSGEDCLFMNAFTPAEQLVAGAPLKPVMFYIHGGGFVGGSATTAWNLTKLTGHVVFAFQYRLGVLGFLSTDSPPNNLGLADQRFALQWVRDNAKSFGGDPEQIMIYGCSAGGASVAGMLTMPSAYGMYKSAGIESPGGHQGWMGCSADGACPRGDDDWMSAKLNVANSLALSQSLGCKDNTDVACMQKLSLSAIYKPSKRLRFAPALPAETYPLGQIQKGKWNKVPVIIGGQSCESCGNALSAFGKYSRSGVTEAQFTAALINGGFSGKNGSLVGPDALKTWYAQRIASEGYWRTYARIQSDSGHACSSTLHAKALGATYSSVWRYFFAYSTNPGEDFGASHGGDESWLMDMHEGGTKNEITLSHDMAYWWTSVNAAGDPNSDDNKGAPKWTPYEPTSAPQAMFLGRDEDPLPRMNSSIDTVRLECEHWKPYLGW